MDKPLRILHLEDQPDFATLVSDFLEKEGLKAKILHVTDFAGYNAAIDEGSFDIIVADYSLPTGNGVQALEIARQKRPETPFLLLSGAIGEHAAVEILRSGATDYVLKSSLERLAPAIRRAVKEKQDRDRCRVAEDKARINENHYRLIFNGSPIPMWISDLKTRAFLEVNEAAIHHYGFAREEFLSMTTADISSSEEAERLSQYLADVVNKRSWSGIGHAGLFRHKRKDGASVDIDVSWSTIVFEDREVLLTMAKDVTDLRRAAEALKKSQARLTAAQRIARMGSWELDLVDLEHLDNNRLHWSEETYRIFGVQPGATLVPSEFFFGFVHPEDLPRIKEVMKQAFRKREAYETEHRIRLSDGSERLVRGRAEFVLSDNGKPVQLRGIVMDVADRQASAAPQPVAAAVEPPRPAAPAPARPAKPAKSGKPARAANRSRN